MLPSLSIQAQLEIKGKTACRRRRVNMQLIAPPRSPAPPLKIDDISRALDLATDPAEIKEIGAKADAFEQYMHYCGLYDIQDIRPVNELRMKARWRLGKALRLVERARGNNQYASRSP